MDPTRTFDYLTRARAKLLDQLRTLTDAQYRQEFPFGMRRLSATLPHMLNAEWSYAHRIATGQRPDRSLAPIPYDTEPPFATIDAAWPAQSERTRAAINASIDTKQWNTIHETRTPIDGRTMIVRAPASEIFMQLLCHEVHHRSQAMSMLRALGHPVQDLDYSLLNFITWEK